MISAPGGAARKRFVDNSGYLAACRRLIRSCGPRVGDGTLEDLAELIALQAAVERATQVAVDRLREAGHTWEELGSVTGHTKQAAIKRWNRSATSTTRP